MKYRELIKFKPVETVIVLNDSNNEEKAKELVKTYIMNDDMAEKLDISIVSQLKLENVVDSKGILLVGNYGTGKSHLMSVISAVAQNENMTEYLTNEKFKNIAKPIQGKFEILRIEIGATKMSFRNIILKKIQDDFEKRGLQFKIPDEEDIINNKDIMLDIMELFAQKYGDKGYFVVVDEFLDYLGGRNEHQLRRDLGFLRELGEIVKSTKFRIILGMQEKLFENPKFSFVSETLNRVKDRFEQMIIRKEDMAYVASERILKKDEEQKAKVREHLTKFTSYYSNMNERMDEFVDLFPIHPAYFDIFEKIYLIENRHILKNISNIVSRIMDKEIDDDYPGIYSFDSYWNYIKEDRSYLTDPNVGKVVEKSGILEDIIKRSFPGSNYKPIAIQIIYGLSVHRLTTGDISIRSGLTAENLKDDLVLYKKDLPDRDSETLQSLVQVVLGNIMQTVSGQFIDYNDDNGQYYLDVSKDIDYDQKITEKASFIGPDKLNHYYFDLIYNVMNWDAREYVDNYKIYEHTLNWDSKNIFRRGYLFLGTPEERPTAQPPRDYYIFFMPPYGETMRNEISKKDEVYFYFIKNEDFDNKLKLFSAASDMKVLAEEKNKRTYLDKANKYKKSLLKYLEKNKNTCFDVKHKDEFYKPMEIMGSKYNSSNMFKETMDLIASLKLEEYFKEKYKYMPKFESKITIKNQAEYLRDSINIFRGNKSPMGIEFLKAFGLWKEDRISIEYSNYANYFKEKIEGTSGQQVINFNDLFKEEKSSVFLDKKFGIDAELLAPVFLSLVYLGHAVMNIGGKTLDASNMEVIKEVSSLDIFEFKYLSKPKDVSTSQLNKMFKVLDLQEGLIYNPKTRDEASKKLVEKSINITNEAVLTLRYLEDRYVLWNDEMLSNNTKERYKNELNNLRNTFGDFNRKYNTAGKLNNFNLSEEEIERLKKGLDILNVLEALKKFKEEIVDATRYMEEIEINSTFKERVSELKNEYEEIKNKLIDDLDWEESSKIFKQKAEMIKSDYIDYYLAEHKKYRLDINQAKKRKKLKDSKIYKKLERLKDFNILTGYKFQEIDENLSEMKVCYELTANKLKDSPICNACNYRIDSGEKYINDRINIAKEKFENLYLEWENILVDTITDPTVNSQKKYLGENEQKIIKEFEEEEKLPDNIDINFINAINSLLKGFKPYIIHEKEILESIEKLGPTTPEKFKEAIVKIIDEKTGGKNEDNIRIIIKREEKK